MKSMASADHTAEVTFWNASRRMSTVASFAVVTAAGLAAYFMSPMILFDIRGRHGGADPWQTLSWFLLAFPAALIFGIMGKVQTRVLRSALGLESGSQTDRETGSGQFRAPKWWTLRTLLGGVAASIVYICAMILVAKLYYGGPLVNYGGPFVPAGDYIEVGMALAGWALSGLSFGLVQGCPREVKKQRVMGQRLLDRLAWALLSSAAWAAACLACFMFFRSWAIGYEPICVSCVIRYVSCALIVGVVVGIAGALALLYRPLSAAFSLVVCLLAVGLAGTVSQPLFSGRVIHPYYILVPDMPHDYPFIERIAFSGDGEVLAVKTTDKWMGEDTGVKILLYRTSNWTPLGQITEGTASYDPSLEFDTNIRIGPPQPTHEMVNIRSRADGKLLHTVDFDATSGGTPDGYTYTPPSTWQQGQLVRADGKTMLLDSEPILSWVSPNDVASAVSPDGRYIVAGYKIGGLWVWKVP
jgi:hypothetical protein